ncbi:hypothetical protein BJF91_01465 [Allorhizobium taibaishanense]|uniref:Methyl-accepting chemotaxis protein n=1 Tax=Allorhizobium taibaishanense TaxID=887144 RepID=A0A1Q9A257_9HYPH|nr:hypothetical protein BJF91_01465 [Allorhizobium taibaishanense]
MTQQNAGASEEMSATSEELAAQAEELQASIAFFKVDSAQRKSAARAAAAPASRPQREPARKAAGQASSPRRGGQPVLVQQARAKGFALDLSMGGPDDEDMEFRHIA